MEGAQKRNKLTLALYSVPLMLLALAAAAVLFSTVSTIHVIVMAVSVCGALAAAVAVNRALKTQAEAAAQLAREKSELEVQSRLNTVIATHTYDCHFIRDLTGKLIHLSPSCAEFTGYSLEELWAMPDLVVMIHDEDLPRIVARINKMRDGDRDFDDKERYRFVRKDGSIRWVETRLTFIPGITDPNETNLMTAIHDITDLIEAQDKLEDTQAELEKNAQLFKMLAENAHDVVALRPYDGDYYYYSPASSRLSGYSIDELLAKGDINELVHPDDRPAVDQRRRDMEAGKVDPSKPMHFRFVKKDGTVRWGEALVSVVPGLDDPNVPHVMTALHDITEQMEARLELQDAKEDLEGSLASIQRDIDLARTMQEAIVPRSFPNHPKYKAAGYMQAARQVGGDFYEFFDLGYQRIGFAIADVSGKGVSSAFFMTISRTYLETAALVHDSPADVLSEVNQRLSAQNPLFLFVTMFYGVLDLRTGKLVFANGGHNPPMVLRASGDLEELTTTKDPMLGVFEGQSYSSAEMTLHADDVLFLYTDGFTEATNTESEFFGDERFSDCLKSAKDRAPSDVIDQVCLAVDEFTNGAEQADDITCLAITFAGSDEELTETGISDDIAAVPVHPKALLQMESVNDLAHVGSVLDQAQAFWQDWDVPEDDQFNLRMSLEEYLVNLINYGYADQDRHRIHITATRTRLGASVVVIDDATPFNLVKAPEAKTDASLEDRNIGGLGIHIIRNMMDHVSYRTEGGWNRMTMLKGVG